MGYYLPDNGHALAIIPFSNASGNGAPPQSVRWGLDLLAPLTQADATRLGNVMIDAWKTLLDASWTIGPVTFYSGPEPWTVLVGGTADPGTGTSVNYSPPNVAWVITKRTPFVGQRYRGRAFISAVSETDVDEGGILNPTWSAGLQTLVNTFKTNVEADASVDVLELTHQPWPSDPTPTPTSIVSLVVQPKVRTIRRRL